MNQKFNIIIAFTVLCGLLFSANVLAQSGGFVPLFNGRNLDGWENINCAPETFTVRDGIIICSGFPTGVMRTAKQYENYILEMEFRHTKEGGNAGLFIHSDPLPATGGPFPRAVECQIMDGDPGSIFGIMGGSITPDKLHPQGWSRALASENRMNPLGEWNKYMVESRDGMIFLSVNGKVVTRAYHANPRKGYIGLEAEGSEVHFRNIRIRELPSSNPPPDVIAGEANGFRLLYNGVDLRGWKQVPGNKGHWQEKNWILEYDGKSEAEGNDRHLWTEEEFGDFILIVDWRLPTEPVVEDAPVILPDGSQAMDENGNPVTVKVNDAGDSGIYLRGVERGQINIWNWPVGSGELWDYRYNQDQPAEIRAGATPILNADNPVGQWNRFEITIIGDRVTVVENGQTVIDNARLPGIPRRGPIALQHHGDVVQFANIFIKELE